MNEPGGGGAVPSRTHSDADFGALSWHDCHVWGLELRVGSADEDDWTSDLVLRLDYIVEWIFGVGSGAEFRVAPAELVFHGVTDPQISIDQGASGAQVALHLPSIDGVEREPIEEQRVYLDRPYYRWRIALNWPAGSEIRFGAVGFTQTLLAEPVLLDRQHFTLRERTRILEPAAERK